MLSVSPPTSRSLRFFSVGFFSLFLTLVAQAAPNSPTNLNVFLSKKATSFTYAFLWTDTSTNETAFIISARTGTSGPFDVISTPSSPTPPNSTGVTGIVLGGYNVLPPGTILQFKVESWNPTGTSAQAPSALVGFAIPADSFNPPSAVTASATSESVIHVSWTDNATTEDGEELEMSTDGGVNYSKVADILFYQQKSIDITQLAPGTSSYRFRLRAYKEGTPRTYTAYSTPVASATTPFFAPTALTATPLANGTINLAWTDNSSAEGGYLIYVRKNGAPTYDLYDVTAPNISTYAVTTNLAPGTNYQFKVTAGYQAASLIESAASNTVNVTTPALQVPSGLAATALAPNTESSIKLTWVDNTKLNVAYEVEAKLTSSTGEFGALADAADGTVFSIPDIFEPGTSYDFRIRPFYQDGTNPRVYSAGYSTPITYVTPFNAPTAPTATVVSDRQIDLTWTDNSHEEGYFAIYFRLSGTTDYFFYDFADENATTFSATGLFAGAAYDFKISSVFYSEGRDLVIESAYTPTVSATTKDGFTSSPIVTFLPDGTYAYTATTSSKTSSRTTWSAADLPAGLSFNTTTGAITGTPTVFGVKNATLSATFSDNRTTTLPLTFRIVRPPAPPLVGTTIGAQTVTVGSADTNIDLTGKFSDPDSESAVRVITNLGTMDFILYNTATPQTVSNFLENYVNSPLPTNTYNGSVFHRSVPGFIVQGGAFKVQSAPNNFSVIPTAPIVLPNEPGISNIRGTVAMAKLGGDPNSATDQFFVNLNNNNSSNLDFQNGGFTAFARVANGGMAVADAIAGLPTGTYNVNLGSTASSMEGWPLTSNSVAMDTTKVVTMTSVAPVSVLSYAIQNNTNATAVSATINGTNLVIHPLSGGQSTVTLRATDLDGNYVDQVFTVTVNQSANAWAASQGLTGNDALPDADPDLDGLSNFHEFAFMSLPNSSLSSARPSFGTTPGATKYGEITFPVRKFTTGLTYTAEVSDTLLPGSWIILWISTDGFLAPTVTSVDSSPSDHTMVTIRDTVASPPAARRFYRVRVTSP